MATALALASIMLPDEPVAGPIPCTVKESATAELIFAHRRADAIPTLFLPRDSRPPSRLPSTGSWARMLSIEHEDSLLPGELEVERSVFVLKNLRAELMDSN